MDKLITSLSGWVVGVIAALGYGGIVVLMAIESACIPLPSEITMPFAGYLVATGRFNLQLVALAGAVGCLLGSYAAYYIGASGGRWLLERYGRYVLIAPRELELADRFFDRWGGATVFWSRLLPVVRTFIAFPAGVGRMRLLPFTLYTLVGSYLWCLALAYAGMELGDHWPALGPYFHRFDGVIAVLLIALAGVAIYQRLKGSAGRHGMNRTTAPPDRADASLSRRSWQEPLRGHRWCAKWITSGTTGDRGHAKLPLIAARRALRLLRVRANVTPTKGVGSHEAQHRSHSDDAHG